MTTLYAIAGIPGSGKSTLAQHISDTSGAVRCSYDDMPGANTRESMDGSVKRAWMSAMRSELENGRCVICDAINLTVGERKEVLAAMSGIPCKKVLVFMDVPKEICLERNARRQARLPDFVIEQAAGKLEPPTIDEGWDEIIIVKEDGSYETDFAGDKEPVSKTVD